MSMNTISGISVRMPEAFIYNRPQNGGNAGSNPGGSADTVQIGSTCTPDIRNRILNLRMEAAAEKSTALKLLGIGAFFGGMVALGGSFLGGAICGCMGALPAGITFANALQAEKQADILQKTYGC
jgi:hypothetical protein